MYNMSNLLKVQVAEFISIQTTCITLASWKWWHCLLLYWVNGHFIIWLRLMYWYIPVLAYVVEHGTYVDHLADLQRGPHSDLTVQDMETAFQLSYATLHNTSCPFVGTERRKANDTYFAGVTSDEVSTHCSNKS